LLSVAPVALTFVAGDPPASRRRLLEKLRAHPCFSISAALLNGSPPSGGTDQLSRYLVPENRFRLRAACMCCAPPSSVVSALEDLLRARDNNRAEPFTHVLLEMGAHDGIAAIAGAIMAHPYLSKRFAVNGIVALEHRTEKCTRGFQKIRCASKELEPRTAFDRTPAALDSPSPDKNVQKQQAMADWLLDDTDDATGQLAQLYPSNGNAAALTRWLQITKPENQIIVQHAAPLSQHQLSLFCEALRANLGDRLWRIKGIINTPEQPFLLHGIGHYFAPATQVAQWQGNTRLLLTGDGLDDKTILQLYDACSTVAD
jgi:G3E family GTPase